jgi:spore coat polysaccharide biosynthesis predicted glycosyltransferase SpsG
VTTTVGIRCDAGPRTGVGHLVRCVALAEELVARGTNVHFLSDLGGLEWAARQLTGRGLPWHPAPYDTIGLLAAADRLDLDALVLDSYELPAAQSRALRSAGRTVLAIVDGDLRDQEADVYVDQNLDAELLEPPLPPGSIRLAGLDYALLRRAVRDLRPATAPTANATRAPRVVAFFGGTDAYRAAPTAARLLIRTGMPCTATIVAADDSLRAELLALQPEPGQRIEVIAPTTCPSCSRTPTWRSARAAPPPGSCCAWACRPRWSGWWKTRSSGTAAPRPAAWRRAWATSRR